MRHSAADILAHLDAVASAGNWPAFDGVLGQFEYHAMRLVAVRERGGDQDWGVAFECVFGDFLDPGAENLRAANVSTYLVIPADPFGIREQRELPLEIEPAEGDGPAPDLAGVVVRGPAGALACDGETVGRLDLRPGMLCGGCDGGAADWRAVLAIRAYLSAHPGVFWGDVTPLFRAPCDVIVTSDAFEHAVARPSESAVFRSLSDALVTGDAARFSPGESNLDWRRWATIRDPAARL